MVMDASTVAAEDLRFPWNVIPSIVETYGGGDHAQLFASVSQHFGSKFARPEAVQQVPVLTSDTAETIPPNSLVRFRGMIIDMYNPEFFLGAYKPAAGGAWKPAALYTDAVPADVDSSSATKIFERRPLLVTPVPHEQSWATAAWSARPVQPQTPSPTDRSKRLRQNEDPMAAAAADASLQASKTARISNAINTNGAAAAAAAAAAAGDGGSTDGDQRQQLVFKPGDCIVQVYDDQDQFRLHDVVEVLGVMSVIPELAAMHNGQQQQQQQGQVEADVMDVDDFWQERTAALPPTSKVMRLHAFTIKKLTPNPLPKPLPQAMTDYLPLLRQRALDLLAAPLAGDELAAEYLLLAAMGSVVNREDRAVGHLPLNLTHCPSGSSSSKGSLIIPGLAAALGCLLPHVALLPLNITTLINTRWYPQQQSESGRLLRGSLQLCDGTLLVLDETDMNAGQLGDNGVKNLHALRQVVTTQQLPCDCQVYTHNLNVDLPTVVLSTSRSILKDSLSIQLPLQPQKPVLVKPPSFDQSNHGQTSGQTMFDWSNADVASVEDIEAAAGAMAELGAVRDYITAVRGFRCTMDQSAAEACVARFRVQQQTDNTLGLEELNNIITLSKLLSASLGHDVFSTDSWDRAMQLEQLRKQRLATSQLQQ